MKCGATAKGSGMVSKSLSATGIPVKDLGKKSHIRGKEQILIVSNDGICN